MKRSGGILWVLLIGGGCIVFNALRYPSVGDSLDSRPYALEQPPGTTDADAELWSEGGAEQWIDQHAMLHPDAEQDLFATPTTSGEEEMYRIARQMDAWMETHPAIAPPAAPLPPEEPREEIAAMSTGKHSACPIPDPERQPIEPPQAGASMVASTDYAATPLAAAEYDSEAEDAPVDSSALAESTEPPADLFVESTFGRAYQTLYSAEREEEGEFETESEAPEPSPSRAGTAPRPEMGPDPLGAQSVDEPSIDHSDSRDSDRTPRRLPDEPSEGIADDQRSEPASVPIPVSQGGWSPTPLAPEPGSPRDAPVDATDSPESSSPSGYSPPPVDDLAPVPPRSIWSDPRGDKTVARPAERYGMAVVDRTARPGATQLRDLPPIETVDESEYEWSPYPHGRLTTLIPIYPSTGAAGR